MNQRNKYKYGIRKSVKLNEYHNLHCLNSACTFNKYLPILIHLFELMGILILTLGVFTAFYHYIQKRFFKKDINIKYEFADVMITTLDFKLAAEILKTVIIKNMDELIIIGAVFILRIIMTFVLEREMKFEKTESKL